MRSLWWTGQWHGLGRKDGEVLEQMANSNNWNINMERNLYTGNARVRFPQADNDRRLRHSSSRVLAPVSDGFGCPYPGNSPDVHNDQVLPDQPESLHHG
jgi:hypothetical protein